MLVKTSLAWHRDQSRYRIQYGQAGLEQSLIGYLSLTPHTLKKVAIEGKRKIKVSSSTQCLSLAKNCRVVASCSLSCLTQYYKLKLAVLILPLRLNPDYEFNLPDHLIFSTDDDRDPSPRYFWNSPYNFSLFFICSPNIFICLPSKKSTVLMRKNNHDKGLFIITLRPAN